MPTVKWRKSPKSQKAEKSGKSEAGKEQASDLSGISDEKKLPDWLKSLITQTVEAEAGRILGEQTFPKSQTVDKEPPPLPGKIKGAHDRPVLGKRVKLAGTADAELVRLLDEWRRERGMSLSRAIDTALWHFLGKPALSFQEAKSVNKNRK